MMRFGSLVFALSVAGLWAGSGLSAGRLVGEQEAPRKLVAPVRGEAPIELTAPNTQVVGNNVVTTLRLKNVASGPIAGLRIEENWFDRNRNPVPGDVYRHPRPWQVGEVIEVKLTTPRKAGMGDNRYNFTHANGTIKTTVVKKLDLPKPVK